jgi:TonB family protein
MKHLRNAALASLVTIPAVVLLAGLTTLGIWTARIRANPPGDREPEAIEPSIKEQIAREVARSMEAQPAAPEAGQKDKGRTPLPLLPSRDLEAIATVTPAYPRIALVTRTQGPVEVLLHVNSMGVPEWGQVLSGNSLLKEEVLKASLDWRFLPALSHGRRVPSDFRIRYEFKLA